MEKPNLTKEAAARLVEVALDALKTLGDGEGRHIYEPTLTRALDPLRRLPALGARCRCGTGVAWWAIDPAGAFVAASQRRAPPKERSGGTTDFHDPNPRQAGRGLAPWIESAASGKTSVKLVDWKNNAGYPLRLRFDCPKCNAVYVLKNTERLRLFLAAIRDQSDTIML